jgi:hypothetical protein
VWLVLVIVARGELLALRWHHIDVDAAILTVPRNYVRANSEGHDNDTKSHQMRPTVHRRSHHRADQTAPSSLRADVRGAQSFLRRAMRRCWFICVSRTMRSCSRPPPDSSRPILPGTVTKKYGRQARALGIVNRL